ncbi:MAG: 4Fe-4S dicluster domain-containing protein [Candidatus Helarchaeota archaeon]
MKDKVLLKNEIPKLIDDLLKDYSVIAPIKKESYYLFDEITSANNVDFSFHNSKIPPKSCFLPQQEVLYIFRNDNKGVKLEIPPFNDKPKVILGIRACDAKSFVLMDKFFGGREFQDNYYTEKRNNTTIIGMACIDPMSTCFCTSVGGSPFATEGLDIQLTEINDKYLVQGVTDKGNKLIEKITWLKDADAKDLETAKDLAKKSEEIIRKLQINNIKEVLDRLFDNPVWEQFSERCVGCAVCTFLCPTCHCFDVVDETNSKGGKRIRIWDSCQLPLFTLHGSGHNPRPSGKERMRQRIMHKFNYYPNTLDEIGCVGCGRCILACPVNQDIRSALKILMNVEV